MELIDRHCFRKALMDVISDEPSHIQNKIGQCFDDFPTVTIPSQVNHGMWNFTSCSLCGESFLDYADADCDHSFYRYLPNYCPNCGACMDGNDYSTTYSLGGNYENEID